MFTEQEMQNILDNSLSQNYRNELTSKQWYIYKEPFRRTVERLKAAKPALKMTAATAKSIADLKNDSNDSGGAHKCTTMARRRSLTKRGCVLTVVRSAQGYVENRKTDKPVLIEFSLQTSQKNKTHTSSQ